MATITFKVDPPDDSSEEIVPPLKTPVKCEQPIYVYAVLFDIRDVALSRSSMIVGVPFLPNGEGPVRSTFNVTDMDYAFHEDLIPYTCTHELPLMNPSFMELMHFDPDVEPKVYPTDRLERMMKEFGPRFEVQSVHRATTDGVRVTAVPFFMGRRKLLTKAVVHYWHYLILIENMTHRGMKLCGVYWNFSYVDGRPLNEYDADFVETPLLPVRSPFFQYHCCFQVPVPNLRARGFFRLEDVDGAAVVVDIPHLTLKDVEYYHELYISDTGSDDGPK
uniref:Polymerase delta interacting protein 2 n=1 Tax=Echinococcus granulosus TaxID=6210 RepID=A0A068WW71_ECHGR|nr:polymerase delta interacting protein 2 [Echinococcus granulosus]